MAPESSEQATKASAVDASVGTWTVEKGLQDAPEDHPIEDTPSPVPYFHLLGRLKRTRRAGWVREGIDSPESISDHMYRMSMMAMYPPAPLASRLDIPRCVKMCLVHDVAEAVVGDITPLDGVSKPEKQRREERTMEYVAARLLGHPALAGAGPDLLAVWREHEAGETLESRFVQDLDKLELLLQMVEYEKREGGAKDLSGFAYVASKIVLPEMEAWAREILGERDEFWKGRGGVGEVDNEHKGLLDKYYA